MEIFSRQKNVAIRFQEGDLKVLLVRHTKDPKNIEGHRYQGAVYSSKRSQGAVVAIDWDSALFKMILLDFVDENLDREEETRMAGKSQHFVEKKVI